VNGDIFPESLLFSANNYAVLDELEKAD